MLGIIIEIAVKKFIETVSTHNFFFVTAVSVILYSTLTGLMYAGSKLRYGDIMEFGDAVTETKEDTKFIYFTLY